MGRRLPRSAPPQAGAAYAQHAAVIVRYLRRRLGDEAAEDAAAEVFLRALSGCGGESLPWLFGIAANVISEHRRAEARRLRALEAATRDAATATTDAPAEPVDPGLVAALRQISDGDREALLLLAWGELSYGEIAQALQVPIGTVRSRIARARRQLRDAASPHHATHEVPCD